MTSSEKNPYAKKPETPESSDASEKKPEDSSAPLIAVPMDAPGQSESPGEGEKPEGKKKAAPAAWPGLEQAAAEGKTAVEKAPRIPTPEEEEAKKAAAAQQAQQGTAATKEPAKGDAKPGEEADVPALVQVPHTSTEPDEGWTAAAVEKNPLASWSLGLGIASLLSLFLLFPPLLVGLAGIIVGALAVRKAKKNTTEGRRMGMSVAGLVMSGVAFTISLIITIVGVIFFVRYSPDIVDCSEKYPAGFEQDQCIAEVIDGAIGR
ncbi:DUF4190 domain-containing protein [Corynebacterium oculi]|uniref:DUF4190 domain-containing protein n=1 Tax=Corynebacterium oculi TaxID=1544416 RepID=A0A0Q0U147_9CORY|nr:DUF4190 domain-containing protein [Corynebacterium oculi]KQB85433.1 hypothetical protein Cocul_00572 [Corynebacterium oculi]